MIRLQPQTIKTIDDAYRLLQMAIEIELCTLPPYLYALYTIKSGTNAAASGLIRTVALQEMIHMCLACNLLNALGGDPVIASAKVAGRYPRAIPGDIGSHGGETFKVHLLPFSAASMKQAMDIEEPEDGAIVFPERTLLAAPPEFTTIGQFYAHLDAFLATLSPTDWKKGRNQIDDAQFFPGELFAIDGYPSAHEAIKRIVSQGEGSKTSPLDFQQELAHFYRFAEVFRNQTLTKDPNPTGFAWSKVPLDVDWKEVYPAIPDPSAHDFSKEPAAAQAAQNACNAAYTLMLQELQRAVSGEGARLGHAVRAMFDLRMATGVALNTPLADGTSVAGPSFLFTAEPTIRSAS